MSNAVLTRLTEERASAIEFVDGLLTQAAEEGRDLVETEQRSLESYRERIAEIDAQMKPIVAFEETRASAVQIDQRIFAPARTEPRPAPLYSPGFEVRGFGDFYVESDEYMQTRGSKGTAVRMDDINPLDLAIQMRAALGGPLLESKAPGKNLLPPPQQFMAPAAELSTPLLDVINRVPVTGNSVDVVAYGDFGGADVVPEGDEKPELEWTTSVVNTPLATIAVWVQYSRQIAQDVPALRQILNSGLTRAVLRKLEEEVMGVINTATGTTTGASGQSVLEVSRAGMAKLQAAGFTPNVLLANPSQLATVDFSIMGLGAAALSVLGGGYWGLRPVPVAGLANDEIYVADASAAMTLFTRTGVEVFTTDSDIIGAGANVNKSAFRANILTTLAEIRAKAALVNQAAITKLVITP